MEGKNVMSTIPNQPGHGSQPIALVSQLRQQAPQMHDIDEMFSWMSRAMVNQWHIPLIQFWSLQTSTTGQSRVELRTVASQDSSLPSSVHANQQVADVVKRLLWEQRGVSPLPTISVFPSSYVGLLARHNIHYWGGYFIKDNVLLPPREAAAEKVATPLSMVITLFLQNPPSERLGRAIDFAFQQGFRVAVNRGFFGTIEPVKPDGVPASSHQQQQLALSSLVPQRTQSIEEFQTGNPFVNATIIPDKRARQIYSLINGQRDVATLARLANLDQKEVGEALHLLLQNEKIQLQDSKGTPIDAAL